jgi:hypothetical protein
LPGVVIASRNEADDHVHVKTVCTSRFRAKALHTPRRLVNALVILVAGARVFPLYGVIKHRGRHRGRDQSHAGRGAGDARWLGCRRCPGARARGCAMETRAGSASVRGRLY